MSTAAASLPVYPAPEEVLRPTAPHDTFTFDELANNYNFERTSDRRVVFSRLLLEEFERHPHPRRILDIGCGSGFSKGPQFTWAIRQHVDDMWGIEPDPSVFIDPRFFNNLQRSMLEEAQLPMNHFDVVYAYLVMEHVVNPRPFMQAVSQCLKPGGAFFFLTPNGRHYFTRIASSLHSLKLDEFVLRMLHGKQTVDWYHYPVAYDFNTPKQINAAIDGLGFEEPKYLFLENIGPRSYFPGLLRPFFWLMTLKRRRIHNPKCLLDLVGCIRKQAR